MSAADVQAEILDPMQRIFYPPRKMEPADEQAALRDYLTSLQDFPMADLASSWRYVKDTHAKTSWPPPAAFVQAASRARRDRAAATMAPRSGQSESNERWDRWKVLSRSPMAYEACKRNVAWSLKCAVLHAGKLAEQIDLRELVSAKHSAEKTAERLRRGEPLVQDGKEIGVMRPGDAATALSMWAGLQEQETKTQAEIRYSA